MKILRHLIIVLFVISALLGQTLQRSELNPEYVKYLDDLQNNRIKTTTASGYSLGYIPPPAKLNTELKNTFLRKTVVFDSRYDLRDYNLVTVAKNQAGCGSCWTFATMGSVESRWLKLGEGTHDLSENNMKNGHDYEWAPCDGGNPYISTSYFTRGLGPISEADDPYADYEDGYTSGLSPQAYIGDAKYLPNNADAIKQAILDYGALYTNMRWEDQYYNSINKTYYCDASTDSSTNHGVLLVGWDDTKVTDGGTGAWIIKNSWGTSWGENGFFYISYNDTKVNSSVAYWPTKYDYTSDTKIGQYDDFGWVNNWGFQDGNDYGLMKYTPENETISMVGTWAVSAGAYLKVEIYDDFNGYSLTNKLAESNTTNCDYAGYYSVPLTSPLTVSADNDVYIKVMYNTGTNYPIPAEQYSEGYAVPTIDYGRYWISSNGNSNSWYSADDYDFDINIKVYSTYATPSVTAEFTASTTSGNAPLSVNFTDQSTGSPTTWYWNFGDGSTSTLQNPSHTYSSGGIYSVSLTVGNGSSSDTETKLNYITVTGGSGISSTANGGVWSASETWVGGVVPSENDNVIINGTVYVDGTKSCQNLTVNSGKFLKSHSYHYTLNINGNLYNYGTIQNHASGWNLTLNIKGNLVNNGDIKPRYIYFVGTNDQTISMISSANFSDIYIYDNNSSSKMITGSNLEFTNCYWSSYDEGNFGEIVLPENSSYELAFEGGRTYNTVIRANGNKIYSTGDHYYSDTMTFYDPEFWGTVISGTNNFFVYGDCIVQGTIQSHNYHYSLKIFGNLINNGTIKDNVSGWDLYTYVTGNIENTGTIECTYFYINGDGDQTISMTESAKFQNMYIYKNDDSGKLYAGSDLNFTNVVFDFNDEGSQCEFVLNENSGDDLYFSQGYIQNMEISANGNKITSEDGHYFRNKITINDPVFDGIILSNTNDFVATGTVINQNIIRALSYNYSFKIQGDLENNGTIEDDLSGWDLTTKVTGNIENNGIIRCTYFYFDGTSGQNLTMSEDAEFNGCYAYITNFDNKITATSV